VRVGTPPRPCVHRLVTTVGAAQHGSRLKPLASRVCGFIREAGACRLVAVNVGHDLE
jgi:hypothetical protein